MKVLCAVSLVVILSLAVGCGSLRTQCTVKVVGRNASVTVQGILAGRTCESILRNPQSVFGNVGSPLSANNSWFEPTEMPQEPQMCVYRISNQTFIVRDYGMLNILGGMLCNSLANQAQ